LPQVDLHSGPDDLIGRYGNEVLSSILDSATLFPEAVATLDSNETSFSTVESDRSRLLALIEDVDIYGLLIV
jgi:hypothetical protein